MLNSSKLLGFAALAFLFATGLAVGADRISVLGGAAISGDIVAISPTGQIDLSGGQPPLLFADVQRIEREVKVEPRTAPAVVYLTGGGQLLADQVTIVDETCQVKWQHGADLSLPLDLILGVRLGDEKKSPRAAETFRKALEAPSADGDRLFVAAGDQSQLLTGVLGELGADAVRFAWDAEEREITRDRVFGLVVAAIGDPPNRSGQAFVTLADGSSLWAAIVSLADGKLNLQPAPEIEVSVPWQAVAAIAVKNDRLAFLSDLTPTEVIEQAIVTFPMSYRRDQSVLGGKLTIAGKQFEKGLGVHSRSSLTYPNEGYDLLVATIGIDDETQGGGDCEFVVQGDERELYRQRVKGREAPREIRLSITGVERVTLLVEPGEDLDVADHADWGEARFIRQVNASTAADTSAGTNP